MKMETTQNSRWGKPMAAKREKKRHVVLRTVLVTAAVSAVFTLLVTVAGDALLSPPPLSRQETRTLVDDRTHATSRDVERNRTAIARLRELLEAVDKRTVRIEALVETLLEETGDEP